MEIEMEICISTRLKGFHLTRWIIFKSGKLSWLDCSNSAMCSEVNLIALIKTLESLEQNTFLLFLRMNLSFRNFLIPDSSQVKRFLRKLLMYSVLGATWFFQRISLLREWRGSKKYEKFSSTEIISPSRDDPVLPIFIQISFLSSLLSFYYWHFTWGRPISGFSCPDWLWGTCCCCSISLSKVGFYQETMLPYYVYQGLLTVSSCSRIPILFPIMRLQRKMNITSFWHYWQYRLYWQRIW